MLMPHVFPHLRFHREVTIGYLLLGTSCDCGVQSQLADPPRRRRGPLRGGLIYDNGEVPDPAATIYIYRPQK